ncbi:MAG: hypothetical protein JW797_20570 [Bradymonadales bacterium]|nr:hypothetical protein [Bradymonadales bacterium]
MPEELVYRSIDPLLTEVLQFFHQHLSQVSFPDASAEVLQMQAGEVMARADEVERIRSQLVEAKSRLENAQAALARTASKAISYARVYAQDDSELTSALDALTLARQLDTRACRRKPSNGRKKKALPASMEQTTMNTQDLALLAELTHVPQAAVPREG